MAEDTKIKIRYTQLSPKVLELRTVLKGRFYSKTYIGWSLKDAAKHFKHWLICE